MESKFALIKNLISINRARIAASELNIIAGGTDYFNAIVLLESRLFDLEEDKMAGIISTVDYNLEFNKIKLSLLEFSDIIEEETKNEKTKEQIGQKSLEIYSKSNTLVDSRIRNLINQKNEKLLNLVDFRSVDIVEKDILNNFIFPNTITFELAIFCIQKMLGQRADKILFIKLEKEDCSFDFSQLNSTIEVISKSLFKLYNRASICQILEQRDDFRLNVKVRCFDRKFKIVMGKRQLTPKTTLLDMQKFNLENKNIEVLTYDGFLEQLGINSQLLYS